MSTTVRVDRPSIEPQYDSFTAVTASPVQGVRQFGPVVEVTFAVDLTATEVAAVQAVLRGIPNPGTYAAIDDYLLARQARLRLIRTRAQAIAATASFTAATRDSAIVDLAQAVDDLSQFNIRLARRVLDLYDATD